MKRTRNPDIRPLTIACFGEALWDVLPGGLFLGGAPLNVAYHLSRHGVKALPLSAVGTDFLGDEIIRRVEAWGLGARTVERLRQWPTGTVRAKLDAKGSAHYAIAEGVAWDRIPVPHARRNLPAPHAIVFGTLALRSAANRKSLTRILALWPDALRVLDLNLRRPFDRGAGVALALAQGQFVKLNDEELARMSGAPVDTAAQIEAAARRFATRHRFKFVCVTAGKRGAGLLWDGEWSWETGRPVVVRDTVGAGDSFLAAFLAARLKRGESPRRALAAACRMGEFVAARDGATPLYECDKSGKPREIGLRR